MNTGKDEQQIQKRVNQVLDQGVQQMSPDTKAQLAERRQRALARAMNKSSPWQSLLRPAPLAAAFSFGLAILLLVPEVKETPERSELIAAQQFDDLLLLSELDDATLELLEEIEFAYWLTEEMDSQTEDTTLETHTYSTPSQLDDSQHKNAPAAEKIEADSLASADRCGAIHA